MRGPISKVKGSGGKEKGRGGSGGARKFFLPGHYRGTTISNGAHLMTCI